MSKQTGSSQNTRGKKKQTVIENATENNDSRKELQKMIVEGIKDSLPMIFTELEKRQADKSKEPTIQPSNKKSVTHHNRTITQSRPITLKPKGSTTHTTKKTKGEEYYHNSSEDEGMGNNYGHVEKKRKVVGCTYKMFQHCEPYNFSGREGGIATLRWVEKTESVLAINKCAEEDKEYSTKLLEYARIVQHLVTPELNLIKRYIWGLICEIRDMVKVANCENLDDAMDLGASLTSSLIRNQEEGKKKNEVSGQGPSPKPADGIKKNARAFVLNTHEAAGKPDVITSTFLVNDIYARVLFESGANQIFIDHRFYRLLNKTLAKLDKEYVVETANGDLIQISEILNDCHITLSGHVIPTRLLPMTLAGFDIVLGMDWLASNQAHIPCDKKAIELRSPKDNILTINGNKLSNSAGIISMLKATKYLGKGCLAYLVSVTADTKKKIEDVPVVAKFPKVFPDELSGIPPEREVEFRINLVPGTVPIAKALYRLAPYEMAELKKQLDELLEKGFIRPSSSPWGVPLLFVKKKDEDHANHLKILLELLETEKLYAKFSKCDFWLSEVQFLGHIINADGIQVDPVKIEAISKWEIPKSPTEVCSFLELAGYYRRFIQDFSRITVPLTSLTHKSVKYEWGLKQSEAFETLKQKLTQDPYWLCQMEIKASLPKELNMRQRRWMEVLNDYECKICHHEGKANALSRKELEKPKRVRALSLDLQINLITRIKESQKLALQESNLEKEGLGGMID
ncbi:hypothetical protein L1987_48230 [Smallanthus sonchifolius]|uniref:Uncharacterized protein n=1 Tax=Smallanthus sonchifolius TaxID=185202 RepID=A0ACB9FRF6_9ASTR|nr:hypothetical protein L1987_48230 [Smallanthus sonchifolius]